MADGECLADRRSEAVYPTQKFNKVWQVRGEFDGWVQPNFKFVVGDAKEQFDGRQKLRKDLVSKSKRWEMSSYSANEDPSKSKRLEPGGKEWASEMA